MNCRTARSLFSARLDHELSAAESQALLKHLDECSRGCAQRWASFELTVRLVHDLPPVEADPAFVGQVLDRVRGYEAAGLRLKAERGRRERSPLTDRVLAVLSPLWSPPVLAPVRVAAVLVFGIAAGFVAAQKGFGPSQTAPSATAALQSVEAPASGSSLGSLRLGQQARAARPFGDLVGELEGARTDRGAADSTAEDANRPPQVAPLLPGDPASSERQVLTSVSDGRPQITF